MLGNLKIGVRLAAGFAVTLLLLVAIALVGIFRVADLQQEIKGLVEDKNVKVKLANEIIENINGVTRSHRNMLLARDDEKTRSEIDRAAEFRTHVSSAFEALEKFSYGDKGKAALEAAREAHKAYLGASLRLEKLIKAKQWDTAPNYFDDTYMPLFREAIKVIPAFVDYQIERAQQADTEAEEMAQATRTLILTLTLTAVALLLGACSPAASTRRAPVGGGQRHDDRIVSTAYVHQSIHSPARPEPESLISTLITAV